MKDDPKVLSDIEITNVSFVEKQPDPNCKIRWEGKKQVLVYFPPELHTRVQHAVIDSQYKNVSQWLEAAAREKLDSNQQSEGLKEDLWLKMIDDLVDSSEGLIFVLVNDVACGEHDQAIIQAGRDIKRARDHFIRASTDEVKS